MPRRPIPTLVVVSGPPGSGKTTLAHSLAQAIPCPAIYRDDGPKRDAFVWNGPGSNWEPRIDEEFGPGS